MRRFILCHTDGYHEFALARSFPDGDRAVSLATERGTSIACLVDSGNRLRLTIDGQDIDLDYAQADAVLQLIRIANLTSGAAHRGETPIYEMKEPT